MSPASVLPVASTLVRGSRGVVPYIASWTGEQEPTVAVVATDSGIAYAAESILDRDARGVLWTRVPARPGEGEPLYGRVHSLRQRRAMRQLLCQVCGDPADHDERGWLWLLPDHQDDWPGWPAGIANTHPPLCLRCARISVRSCPHLRAGYVAVRAHSAVAGITGLLYRARGCSAEPVGMDSVAFTSPAIRWIRAVQLVRRLYDCTITTDP